MSKIVYQSSVDLFFPEDLSLAEGRLEGTLWRRSALRCVYVDAAKVEVIFIGFQNAFQEIACVLTSKLSGSLLREHSFHATSLHEQQHCP